MDRSNQTSRVVPCLLLCLAAVPTFSLQAKEADLHHQDTTGQATNLSSRIGREIDSERAFEDFLIQAVTELEKTKDPGVEALKTLHETAREFVLVDPTVLPFTHVHLDGKQLTFQINRDACLRLMDAASQHSFVRDMVIGNLIGQGTMVLDMQNNPDSYSTYGADWNTFNRLFGSPGQKIEENVIDLTKRLTANTVEVRAVTYRALLGYLERRSITYETLRKVDRMAMDPFIKTNAKTYSMFLASMNRRTGEDREFQFKAGIFLVDVLNPPSAKLSLVIKSILNQEGKMDESRLRFLIDPKYSTMRKRP